MEPGQDAHPIRDGAGRWIERHIERGIFPRTNQPRVAQRELPRSSARTVVPRDADECLTHRRIAYLDGRAQRRTILRHGDEVAFDPPCASARHADEQLGAIAAE